MSARFCPGAPLRARGIALLEVLGALAIGALLMAGLAGLIQQSLDDLKGQQSAYHQAQIVEATRKYLAANAALLTSQTPTAATVLPVTLAQLRSAGFLPAGFGDLNPYGQGSCVLVRRPAPANPANPGNRFDALVVTTGTQVIPAKDLPAIAMQVGDGGGHIVGATPGIARGASWQISTDAYRGVSCSGGTAALQGNTADVGHLVSNVFYDGAAQLGADYLYRDRVPGRPELNQMRTPLRFVQQALVGPGESCRDEVNAAQPAIAVDRTTRALLTCSETGTWSSPSSWKKPVVRYADLAAQDGNAVGDVRMVTELDRAFTYGTNGWVALAVDESNNLKVPGTVFAGVVRATQAVQSDGTISASTDLTVGRDMTVRRDVRVVGNIDAEKNVTVGKVVTADGLDAQGWLSSPAVSVWDQKNPGDACNYYEPDPETGGPSIVYPYGTIMMDASWRPVICGPNNIFWYANGKQTIQ